MGTHSADYLGAGLPKILPVTFSVCWSVSVSLSLTHTHTHHTNTLPMACQDRQIYIDLCILGQVAEHWALVTYLPVSGSSEASASARGSDKDRHRPGEGGGLQASQHLVNIHRNDALTTLGGCQHQHLVNTHRNDALTTLGGGGAVSINIL